MPNTFFRFSNGHLTADHVSIPIPIDPDFSLSERIIFACLLHWLENETHAHALTPRVAKMFPKKLGKGEWLMALDELQDAIILALVQAKEHLDHPVVVEYLGGQRRDTVRAMLR